MRYDVIIVGSGHNGLITAAYLARAGHRVAVFERRGIVGGAVCTQDDILPGYQIDVGSSAHVMIHSTPVLVDLDLESYGLEYLDMDPWAVYPETEQRADGCWTPTGRWIRFYKDLDATCESIAALSPADAVTYRRFVQDWGALNAGVFKAFLRPPTPMNLVSAMMGKQLGGSNRIEMIRKLMGSYGQLVTETFENESLRSAILWLAAQSGPPPAEMASGDFAGWHAMYHQSGMKRPRGGSGMLTQALKKRIEHDGGAVFTNAPVREILLTPDGRKPRGISLEDGTVYESGAVVAACHIKTTLDRLLVNARLPENIRVKSRHLRMGNGFGMIVRCAMSGLPEYPGLEPDMDGDAPEHHGLQLLCPNPAYLDAAYADYLAGRTPEHPVPLVMTFSALDSSLAPAGKHVMYVWGQYYPYALSSGEDWEAIEEREAEKLLQVVERYAPGTRAKVENWYIQSPLGIEKLHGMHRGNVMHLEMSFDQMFLFRPMSELAGYRFPGIRGLYLTGASTHPGGGVWGASGHNTAKLMLKERRKWTH